MGKVIDMTGKKIGQLLVLQRAQNKGRDAAWLCLCSCGNKKVIRGADLRSGNTKSCGCLNTNGTVKNEIGNKYKSLTVISRAQNIGRLAAWLCECECGRKIIVKGHDLRQGSVTHCGCKRFKDISGQKFGKLTALSPCQERGSSGCLNWICQCECGNKIIANGGNLRASRILSCGCVKSKGEQKIASILQENNLSFVKEKTFSDCIFPDSQYHAKFDFYVENSYLIEYDGIQHFQSSKTSTWNTENLKQHDIFKNNYAKQHNIPLIRIPYTQYSQLKLQDLLLTTTNFLI